MAGNRLRQIEQARVFLAAKILRAEKLRRADDLRAAPRRFTDFSHCAVEVRLGIGAAGHLHQADAEFFGEHSDYSKVERKTWPIPRFIHGALFAAAMVVSAAAATTLHDAFNAQQAYAYTAKVAGY